LSRFLRHFRLSLSGFLGFHFIERYAFAFLPPLIFHASILSRHYSHFADAIYYASPAAAAFDIFTLRHTPGRRLFAIVITPPPFERYYYAMPPRHSLL
jgi:hypothetical protein